MEELKFPIGKFQVPSEYTDESRAEYIQVLAELPMKLKEVLVGITIDQLSNRYRPEAWTIRQVVHHLADSHMNSLIRFKLGLTEDNPTIKPYNENLWANLADGNSDDITPSILMIEGIHARLVKLLKSVSNEDWERKVHHPESKRDMSMNFLLALYAWHSKHHLAHIKNALANPY